MSPLLLCLALVVPSSHPGHATYAEARYNAQAARLEVSLRVVASALEEELGAPVGPDDADSRKRLAAWVGKGLRFERDGKPCDALHCVGHEVEGTALWIHFSVALPKGLADLKLTNTLFFNGDEPQLNTVRFEEGNYRRTLTFLPGRATREIRPSKVAAPKTEGPR